MESKDLNVDTVDYLLDLGKCLAYLDMADKAMSGAIAHGIGAERSICERLQGDIIKVKLSIMNRMDSARGVG